MTRSAPLGTLEGHRQSIQGLYLHVPFCAAECAYCGFYREVPRDRLGVAGYLAALGQEAAYWRERFGGPVAPETLYVGGGTPSFLTPGELEHLARILSSILDRSQLREVTVEANPESASWSALEAMRRLGMTRLSLGVQSCHPSILALLGRRHGWPDVLRSVASARCFPDLRLNLDLIYGVPTLGLGAWRETVRSALDLRPDHLSAYCLTFEEGSALARRVAGGELSQEPEEVQRDCYEALVVLARAAGLERYEVSNFAVPGREARHNLGYWRGGGYLGLGPSAHSAVAGLRLWNLKPLAVWRAALDAGKGPLAGWERITDEMAVGECLMRLRLAEGIPRSRVRETALGFWSRIRVLEREGLVKVQRERLTLTDDAFFVSDAVISDLWAAWECGLKAGA